MAMKFYIFIGFSYFGHRILLAAQRRMSTYAILLLLAVCRCTAAASVVCLHVRAVRQLLLCVLVLV